MIYPWLIWFFLILLFLSVGSFLNVVIHRLPLMLNAEWTADCYAGLNLPPKKTTKLSLAWPGSHCPACKKPLKIWHNIPLLSYLALRGHCAYCNTKISLRYPCVEITCLILSLFAVWFFGWCWSLCLILSFIWILICLFFIDLQHQLLPDVLSLGLLWLGLLINTQNIFTPLSIAVFSAAGAYLSLWLFMRAYLLIRGKVGMGHGDFKLFAAFGAWFGWSAAPLILLVSSISGILIGFIYLKATRQSYQTPIPFGPFLCIAGIITLFYRFYGAI